MIRFFCALSFHSTFFLSTFEWKRGKNFSSIAFDKLKFAIEKVFISFNRFLEQGTKWDHKVDNFRTILGHSCQERKFTLEFV